MSQRDETTRSAGAVAASAVHQSFAADPSWHPVRDGQQNQTQPRLFGPQSNLCLADRYTMQTQRKRGIGIGGILEQRAVIQLSSVAPTVTRVQLHMTVSE
ncbi:uncharacterized protein V6R79_004487 [Siganus canaliculatus]